MNKDNKAIARHILTQLLMHLNIHATPKQYYKIMPKITELQKSIKCLRLTEKSRGEERR